jgi:hypothetical protein
MFVKLTEAEKTELRAAWPELARQATPDEIAVRLSQLIRMFPNLPRDVGAMVDTVAVDLHVEKASLYEVTEACRTMRRNHKFFSEAELLAELSKARQAAKIFSFHARGGRLIGFSRPVGDWDRERTERIAKEERESRLYRQACLEALGTADEPEPRKLSSPCEPEPRPRKRTPLPKRGRS